MSDRESEFVFTFPKDEALKNWAAIQDYARESSMEIEWDVIRNVLVVKDDSIEPHRVIDDVGHLVFEANNYDSDEFYWDQGWHCSIEIGTKILRLYIAGDAEESTATIQQLKASVTDYLRKSLPVWMHAIATQTYSAYSARFSEGSPCSRDVYLQTLRVTDEITFDRESNKYELYVTASPRITTHLIHLVEIPGVHFDIDFERVT